MSSFKRVKSASNLGCALWVGGTVVVALVGGAQLHSQENCLPAPSGLVAWWRAEGNGTDSADGHHASVPAGVGYTNAVVGHGFFFDGGAHRIIVPDAPELNFGSNQDFSIEAWIMPLPADTTFGVMSIVDKRREDILGQDSPGYEFNLENGRIHTRILRTGFGPAGPDLRDGRFHHVAVTFDRDSPTGGTCMWMGK